MSKIYVAGHRGLVGSAIVRRLRNDGIDSITRTSNELDLRDQDQVNHFFREEQPDQVYLAAAKVGGILANSTYPAEFIRDNLEIQNNVIHGAWKHGTKKLCFLGSSCIYPKHAPQPMKEQHLLTGPLEPTNEWYAIAKIAGIKMCQAYRKQYGFDSICLMPTNLYGPGDNFDLQTSHVLPAMIRRFHEAKKNNNSPVTLWGTGSPKREFLHVDDLADAIVFLMKNYSSPEIINIGVGKEISIKRLAELVQGIIGHKGAIEWDAEKPDGTQRKLLDINRLTEIGWKPRISLPEGIAQTYAWYQKNEEHARSVTA